MSATTINPLSYSPSSVRSSAPVSNLTVDSQETSEEKTLDAGAQFSGVSSFAMAMHLSELSLSSTSTQFAYRSDNSLAVQARSQIDFTARTEEYRFDITLTADALGLTTADFVDPTKPMTIQLKYAQSQLNISHEITIQQVETLRTPQEILQDLATALREVFKDPKNKSVSYVLDSEALTALAQSDPKMAELFGELIMMMAMVNLMKKHGESSHDYTIFVSGKGKPYLDIQQKVNGELVNQSYEFNITVLTPETGDAVKAVEAGMDTAVLTGQAPSQTE